MWIRNQRRDKLIDCSHIEYVRESGIEFIVSNDTVLATYPTKDRCLEVLDEIEKHILNYTVKNTTYVPVVYQMPKE